MLLKKSLLPCALAGLGVLLISPEVQGQTAVSPADNGSVLQFPSPPRFTPHLFRSSENPLLGASIQIPNVSALGPEAFNTSQNDSSFLKLPNMQFTRNFGVIDRMGSALTFLHTPFAEQIHLPVASLWGGRVKLRGFDSNISTADILWGPPGAGSWNILRMGGVRFPAVRIPQSGHAYGMYLAFHLHGSAVAPMITPWYMG